MNKDKKVLLTGGAGFIGSHTIISLVEKGYTPIVVDDFRNAYPFILKHVETIIGQSIELHQVDCGDYHSMKPLFEKYSFEGVIHFAAYKAVGESVELPLKYYSNNINSLVNILQLMEEFHVNHIVFSSSCTVYGTPNSIPVTEETETQPSNSPYGETKKMGERICKDWVDSQEKKNVTLLRYFNPIGAHPSGTIGELPIGAPLNIVPYLTQSVIGKRPPLTVFGDDYETPDGSGIRDYIHVVDLANAHVQALDKMMIKEQGLKIYNVGTGTGTSVLELINSFEKVNQIKVDYKIGPRRAGDVPAIYADTTKVEKELGWKAKYSVDDCMKHAWQWEVNLKEKYSHLIDGTK